MDFCSPSIYTLDLWWDWAWPHWSSMFTLKLQAHFDHPHLPPRLHDARVKKLCFRRHSQADAKVPQNGSSQLLLGRNNCYNLRRARVMKPVPQPRVTDKDVLWMPKVESYARFKVKSKKALFRPSTPLLGWIFIKDWTPIFFLRRGPSWNRYLPLKICPRTRRRWWSREQVDSTHSCCWGEFGCSLTMLWWRLSGPPRG